MSSGIVTPTAAWAAVPMLHNPCGEEFFPNVWSKLLAQLEAISFCSIHLFWTYLAGWLFHLFRHLLYLPSFLCLVNLGYNLCEPLCFFGVRYWFLKASCYYHNKNKSLCPGGTRGLNLVSHALINVDGVIHTKWYVTLNVNSLTKHCSRMILSSVKKLFWFWIEQNLQFLWYKHSLRTYDFCSSSMQLSLPQKKAGMSKTLK